MKFTDTKFIEAVELIQATDAAKIARDKRRAPRHAIRVPIAIKLKADANTEWSEARLHDISPRGVKLKIAIPLEPGSSFLLRLPSRRGKNAAAPLICRVTHCLAQRHSTFLIGAEFTGRLTPRKSAGEAAADQHRIRRSILE